MATTVQKVDAPAISALTVKVVPLTPRAERRSET